MMLSKDNAISIAFPDDGAFKRFHTMFKSFPTITCTKIRDKDHRIVKVKDGSFDNIVISFYGSLNDKLLINNLSKSK